MSTKSFDAVVSSEELLGRLLGTRRDEVVIATKFGSAMGEVPYRRGGSRRWIREAVGGGLRRLRLID